MLDFLYTFFIAPLEYWMEVALIWAHNQTGHWGEAIILMSLLVNFVILPIYMKAESWQEEERAIAKSFADKEAMIRRNFKGQERFAMLSTMQRQAHYSPLLKLRSSVGFILQVPFFFAAYHFLSHFEPLAGVSFLGLHDLAKPDALIHFGSISINVMPFVMTVVNLASALIYTKNLTKKDKNQLYAMAALFLVLLYDAASGLVLYWTINNVFSLVKNYCYILYDLHRDGIKKLFMPLSALYMRYQESMRDVFSRLSFFSEGKTFVLLNSGLEKIFRATVLRFLRILEEESYKNDFALMIFLAGLMPATVLWFSNLSYFSLDAVTTSFFTVSAILALFSGCFLLLRLLCFNSLTRIVFSFAMIFVASFVFYKNSYEIFLASTFSAIAKGSIIVVCFGMLIFFGKVRTVNLVLVVSTLCGIISGIYCYVVNNIETIEALRKNQSDVIELKQKPNIYYVLCESMQSLDIAKYVYGYEGGEDFRNFLVEQGFQVPQETYSNGDHTLATLYNVFTMSEKPAGTKSRYDASIVLRDTIAGGEGNRLLKILKKNGYVTTEFFQGETYYFQSKKQYLDVTDISGDNKLNPLDYLYFYPIISFSRDFSKWSNEFGFNKRKPIEKDYVRILKKYIQRYVVGENKPSFFLTAIHETLHTNSETQKHTDAKKWVASHKYLKGYARQVQKIKEYIKIILKEDPESVIIFLGDHGPRRYGQSPNTRAKLIKVLRTIPDSEKNYFDDRFKIFAAVRIPKRYGKLSEPFSPGNIFVKIFETIGYEGPKLVEGQNDSYATRMTFTKEPILRNGVLIKSFKDAP